MEMICFNPRARVSANIATLVSLTINYVSIHALG